MTNEELDAVRAMLEASKSEEDISKKSKTYNWTKIAIIIIACIVMVIGIFGSMRWGVFQLFSMDDFVKFLDSYKGIFISLIDSIGGGGAIKNIVSAYTKKKNGNHDDGESLAKGG